MRFERFRPNAILKLGRFLLMAATCVAVTPAIAKRCYEVVNAEQLYMRAWPSKKARVVSSVLDGTSLRKIGLPVCGVWWCKVRTDNGEHVGYVRSRHLSRRRCRRDAFVQSRDVSEHGLSRNQLYQMFIVEKGLAPFLPERPKKLFRFPRDVDDGKIYGIDVSHHNGNINWQKVSRSGAKFAYLKATEGVTFVDRRFATNLARARKHSIAVGAYHFFSSGTSPKRQVENYLRVYGRIATKRDLPPVLDLEWDPNRKRQDRWKRRTPKEIVDRALVWLRNVERELGVRPIIYTNKNWWETRIGRQGARLRNYGIWMSRYGKFGRSSPPMPKGLGWVMWQFTEHGKIAGVRGNVDVNFKAPNFNLSN